MNAFPIIIDDGELVTETYFMGHKIKIHFKPKTDQPFIEVRFIYCVRTADDKPVIYVSLEQSPEDYHFVIMSYNSEGKFNYGPSPQIGDDKDAFVDTAKKMVFHHLSQVNTV